MSFLNRVGIKSNAAKQVPSSRPNAGAEYGRAVTPNGASGKPLYLCQPFVKAALVKGSFRTIVSLPRYCDVNEVSRSIHARAKASLDPVRQWVAVNLVDFFNSLNLFLSVTSECCNNQACPTMSAGPRSAGSHSFKASLIGSRDRTAWTIPGPRPGPTVSRSRSKCPHPNTRVPVPSPLPNATLTRDPADRLCHDVGRKAARRRGHLPHQGRTRVQQHHLSRLRKTSLHPIPANLRPPLPRTLRPLHPRASPKRASIQANSLTRPAQLSSEGHLNSLFAHFLQFGIEFDLIELRVRLCSPGIAPRPN